MIDIFRDMEIGNRTFKYLKEENCGPCQSATYHTWTDWKSIWAGCIPSPHNMLCYVEHPNMGSDESCECCIEHTDAGGSLWFSPDWDEDEKSFGGSWEEVDAPTLKELRAWAKELNKEDAK